jgi:hypothetical protein
MGKSLEKANKRWDLTKSETCFATFCQKYRGYFGIGSLDASAVAPSL